MQGVDDGVAHQPSALERSRRMIRRDVRRLLAFDVADRAEDVFGDGRPEREERPAGPVGVDP